MCRTVLAAMVLLGLATPSLAQPRLGFGLFRAAGASCPTHPSLIFAGTGLIRT